MNQLLRKIYNDVLVYEKDIVKSNKQVDSEVNKIIEPYKNNLHDDELEKLKDLVSAGTSNAEQAGFESGVKFAIKMLYSLIND